jgi:hypothetical protein
VKNFACLCIFALVGGLSLPLYAQQVKRVTTVINGRLSRAGSSPGRQAYNDAALRDLCEQGYTLAIYVYGGAKAHDVSCSRGKISYLSMSNWARPQSILNRIGQEFSAGGKVMVHCWYGVHASNIVTSLALNRFCGFNGQQAASAFKAGVPNKSLPPSKIEAYASSIRAQAISGGQVLQGCPTPR